MMTPRYRETVVFLLVTILALSAAVSDLEAQAWWFGKNKLQYKDFEWLVLKTPHFDLHFTGEYEELAARTAVILEYGYGKLSQDFSHNIRWRIPVILYGSHADFQQTNILWSIIPEGVQAFAEPNRRRMVIHYSGEDVDFAHTTIHELVHIFSYDIIYGNLLRSVFTRNMLFQIPLWFMEGVAEYYSVGYDETAEMFMRDATVFDYLPDLPYSGGYMAYKSGQAAIYYLNETYGPNKVVEIMDHLRYQRSIEMALRSSLGITSEELSREWKKNLRRRYWPLYADKKEAEEYGRRLTDHFKDHNYMNTKPVFSPDGEYIVYFSDRKGLDGIYLMNALSGKVEKKLLIGSMSERFESIRSMKSRLTFSPDGSRISFVAKSNGEDRLFIMEVPSGRITDEIELPLDFFHSPSWSPRGDEILVVGTIFGQTDLYTYDLASKELAQLTSDPEGERDPSWFPESDRIVFTRFPVSIVQPEFAPDSTGVIKLNDVDFKSMDNLSRVDGDIWSLDLESGAMEMLISTPGNDLSAVVLPGEEEIIFTSNEKGVSNLYRGSIIVGSYYRFTDVLGGLFTPSYSPKKDRLVFTAFSYAGYDIFVMESFSAKSKISYSTGSPMLSDESRSQEIGPEHYLTAGSEPDTTGEATAGADTASVPVTPRPEGDEATVRIEGVISSPYRGAPEDILTPHHWPIYQEEGFPDIVVEEDMDEDIPPDSLTSIRELALREIGTVKPYNLKFSPDYVGNGMGLFFSTGFGFGMVNQIAFSDLLGDHHLYFSFNIYRSFEDSDLMFSYYFLKKRIDYAVGAFQFKNYLNSRVSSVGETFLDYRLFTERNYGIFGLVSFPFSTFTRFDLEFQGFISEREFFDRLELNEFGDYMLVPGDRTTRRLFQPTLSLVHDSAYYGLFGPVIGSRWMLSVSRTIPFSGGDVSRTTAFFDYRKYMPVWYRNYLAFRTMGAVSEGSDNRLFFLGGPLTMRGYDYLQFSGSRMVMGSLEYRYPLLDAIIFGWPGRWGISNIGGTVFLDSGAVWGDDVYIEPIDPRIKPRIIEDIKFYSDFGIGFYMRFGFLILNFQVGWPTDFSRTGEPMYHFYLGPMF
jgi:Tol biopolymer transport system component